MTRFSEDLDSLPKLKAFLDEKYLHYNQPEFISTDPIQIPHRFTRAEDIEIAGFLAATIAWGQRKTIITNASKLMLLMGNAPYDFVLSANDKHFEKVQHFVHRTFNGDDCMYFMYSLRNIYLNHGGLRTVFENGFAQKREIFDTLIHFRNLFFELEGLQRTGKHVSDVCKGASAKRLNMFLRWMVRNDGRKVDFGLWTNIPTSALYLPLDLHTGNVARRLNILQRKQNDWKAVSEVTQALREMDASDPVKYDFALFGLGIFEGWV
jgi:uncharacterized protein (TIGR02757 family)